MTSLELSKNQNIKTESVEQCSKYFLDTNIKRSLSDYKLDINENEINLDTQKFIKEEQVSNEALEAKSKKLKWEPSKWEEVFKKIKQMRQFKDAPVDTMGCDAICSIDPNLPAKQKRYQILVSLMLSSQTKDEVTSKAMACLQKMPLNIENFLATADKELEKMIYPVCFYKRKVQYIKRTSRILKDKYDGDIPENVNELCKLPGVGPKMAYIAMSCAWNKTVGIGVDTHVHRVANRLGWTKTCTKLPENTRKELEDWLPESYWTEINPLLVGFGQQICRPIGPKCIECICNDICPTGIINLNKNQSKITKKKAVKTNKDI